MAVTTEATAAAGARLVGPDVVRAVALIGVALINYHGYLIIRGGERDNGFFDPFRGPLATRFAATFVLTAGVGVTLLTRRAVDDAALTSARRWTLVRRGLLLFGTGLLFDFVWRGTILPFYGAMFVLAATMFTLPTMALAGVGLVAALAAAGIAWWGLEARLDGRDVSWMYEPGSRSPRGVLLDVFVNGTHPLLPWLAFLCAGMIVGRLLTATLWRPLVAGIGMTLFGAATIASGLAGNGERVLVLASTDHVDRGLLYTASAVGTALVAFAVISWLAERFADTPVVEALASAGAMTLTLYVAHALVFNLVVDWLDVVEPGGLGTAVAFAAVFWVVAIAFAWWYRQRFAIGPLEWLYRRLSD